jgi:hypothetical protein
MNAGRDSAATARNATEVMAVLIERGMLLQSARGPIPNVAELVVGAPIKGSWWAHAQSHAIFDVLNEVVGSPNVVRLKLVNRKVTLVHRRLWPALVRVADHLDAKQLAAIHEEHTSSGAHRTTEQPFPDWVPADVVRDASRLSVDDALALLPAAVAATVTP